jgi:hypothetical protein
MLRDDIARIVYEGYTGMPWTDEDEHLNNAARKHADEIMELPEIKQAEKMKIALRKAKSIIHFFHEAHWETSTKLIRETYTQFIDDALRETDQERTALKEGK